jgi:predicted double-glycine peptidase
MGRSASCAALLLLLCAAGCAINPNSDLTAFARNSGENSFEVFGRSIHSPQALVLPVAHDRQTSGPSCGAHALASVVNYWRGPGTLSGEGLYQESPPARAAGYSMAELNSLAHEHGLLASSVRMSEADVIRELESGRPVLVPVRLPSIYVQQRALPGGDAPVVGVARNALVHRAGRTSEWTRLAMVDHYLLVAGYDEQTFVVVEPVMGYRTISFSKLARYRAAFGNAAIVFSVDETSG